MGEEALVFAMEVDLHNSEPRGDVCSSEDGLIAAHMKFLTRPLNQRAAQLKHDADLCTIQRNCGMVREHLCSPQQLAAALNALGYTATVHRSAAEGFKGTHMFRKLRHTFIIVLSQQAQRLPPLSSSNTGCACQQTALAPGTVCGGAWPPAAVPAEARATQEQQQQHKQQQAQWYEEPLLVDPHFACQFVVANPSPRYAALQRLLPQTFVGTAEQLEHVVEWTCREMEWSFKQQCQARPPWRELGAMLSKWQPRSVVQPAGGPSCCASPAGSPPAACCCRGAGATHAAAAAALQQPAAACAADCGAATAAVADGPASQHLGCDTPHVAAPQTTRIMGSVAVVPLPACSGSSRSGPSTPTHQHEHSSANLAGAGFRSHRHHQKRRPTSLLSRSLEAAGLRPTGHQPAAAGSAAAGHQHGHADSAQAPPVEDWWQPRIHVVHRGT